MSDRMERVQWATDELISTIAHALQLSESWLPGAATRLALAHGVGLWYAYLQNKAIQAAENSQFGFSVDEWNRFTEYDQKFVQNIFAVFHPQ